MIAILGPTSSGKTSTALKLASKFNLSIISADSRQIYRYFDIGTGKTPIVSDYKIEKNLNSWNMDGVEIYGYDIAEPHEVFSSVQFSKFSKLASDRIQKSNKNPILVGGTGYYAEMAISNTTKLPEVLPDYSLRQSLKDASIEQLHQMLPSDLIDNLNESEKKNRQRLIRKIEISNALGSIPEFKVEVDESKVIVFTAPNEYLFERADLWLQEIWEPLKNEVNILLSKGYEKSIPMKGIIYKTMLQYIQKKTKESVAYKETKFDLHSYIRRQKTWFKKYKNAHIIDISEPNTYNKLEKLVSELINGK